MSDQLSPALHGVTRAEVEWTVANCYRKPPRMPPDAAEDLVQEVFAALLTTARVSPGRMKHREDVLGYAYRVARNKRADYLKRSKRLVAVGDAIERVPSPTPVEMTEFGTCEQLTELLPASVPRLRAVFLPLCLKEATQEEVAVKLGCASATVRRLWARARKKLRRRFGLTPEELP